MAFTVTKVDQDVSGKLREVHLEVTADAASGVIDTGLGYVTGFSNAPISMATAGIKLKRNLNDASAAANGKIFASSCAAGDVFFVVVKGR